MSKYTLKSERKSLHWDVVHENFNMARAHADVRVTCTHVCSICKKQTSQTIDYYQGQIVILTGPPFGWRTIDNKLICNRHSITYTIDDSVFAGIAARVKSVLDQKKE